MKNMQRILSFLIYILLVFGLVGCGTQNNPTSIESAPETSEYDHEHESSAPVSTEESSEPVPTEETDPENHTHEYAAEVTKDATCLESGIRTYTCKCGDSYEEEIPATGHNYSLKSIDNNEHQAKCTRCSEVKTEAHKTTSKVTKKASCGADGVKTYTCECGYSFTETIAATGHSYTEKVVKPTETAQGYTEHTCSKCGDSYRDQYTQQELSEVEKKADSIIAKIITKGMSEYDKAKAIHDYICENVEYDYTYSKGGVKNALLGGSVVCDGYASAFSYLCWKAGLDCYYVSGKTASGESHAWNNVKIDGEWYNVDCTWDDNGSYASYTNFLVPDEVFSENHKSLGGKECTSWKYYLAYYKETFVESTFKHYGISDDAIEYWAEINSLTDLQEKIKDAYDNQYFIVIYWVPSKAGVKSQDWSDLVYIMEWTDETRTSGAIEGDRYPDMLSNSMGSSSFCIALFGPNPNYQ